MSINELWAVIEPFVTAIAGTAAGGFIVGIICRLLQGRLLQKLNADRIADRVAEKFGDGLTVGIDLTAVTEKKLDKINKGLLKHIEKMQAEISTYKRLLVAMGRGLAHLKSLSAEEKTELNEAIIELDSNYVPPKELKPITVKLEKIPVNENAEENPEETVEKSLINFDTAKR